ncbi:hypothetical protein [Bradyrhizobium sp. JYMT SZCCT0428]|uniref:hypothetical protein n=1 Tax=Bradyrhizobium sp. JYMT SZCCT0428 TaxID=2807673 RepID=UPI001BAB9A60|nr:hypothetical protein [Bradyrhizobium sp. JYMT SZCCT0428]MBR1154626.1 hypothetical protein [Bradyrhizobium sp. JYMT SZCCT0428]
MLAGVGGITAPQLWAMAAGQPLITWRVTQRNPECKEHMMAAGKLAEKFEPELYSVASVHD